MKKQLLLTRMLLLVALLVGSVGSAWATDITYTFTTKLWAATAGGSEANWTSGAAGDGYSNNGIQVLGNGSANGTSPVEYPNISQIVVTYNTNKSQGAADLKIKIGNNDEVTNSVAFSGSADGRTANFTSTFNFTPTQSGYVKLTVDGTTNSVYICSVRITYSTGPSISASDKDIAYDATSGEFSYTLNNLDGGELSATADVDWISNVVVNTGTNKVTFNTTANSNPTSRVGTITMTYKKGDETLATKEVTITQAKAVVILNYSLATQVVPGRHYIITSGKNGSIKAMGAQAANNRSSVDVSAVTNTISISSDAGVYEFVIAGDVTTGYYTIYDIENAGYLYAASSSSNYLRNKGELDANGKWTIDIDNDGVATIKAQGTNSRNWIRNNGGIFSCYTGGQADIYLFERDGDTSVQNADVSIAANKEWITYCCPFALDFSEDIEGLEGAYTISSHTSGATTLTATKMDGMVKAGTGLLLHAANIDADKAQAIAIKMAGTGVEQSGNMLKGVIVDTEITPTDGIYTNLGLKNGTFVPYSAAGTIAANKAYLQIPTSDMPTAGAKLTIVFGEKSSSETDGIKAVSTSVENDVRYNLAGQKVGADYKGIVIVNGKKVIIK